MLAQQPQSTSLAFISVLGGDTNKLQNPIDVILANDQVPSSAVPTTDQDSDHIGWII